MKLQLRIDQVLTQDTAQTLKLVDQRPTEYDTTMNEGGGPGVVKVPPSTTDTAIPFGAVAAGKYLFIETDYEITVKLNGTDAARAIKLTPRATVVGTVRTVDVKGKLLLVTSGLTSLYITNADATATATVFVSLVGD